MVHDYFMHPGSFEFFEMFIKYGIIHNCGILYLPNENGGVI